ncbi:hypothetical protein VAE308_250004 [Vibrio aestuarianus]|nr:hypothetical protein VAE308_250004 [Vibrio aestuarianus]
MDYPQLKQQLGHISMAMTKWYARNAWSFKKIYTEVQNMRNAKCEMLKIDCKALLKACE